MQKNKEVFKIIKIYSLEVSKFDLTKDDMNAHLHDLNEKLQFSRVPYFNVNMDESGFIRKPKKKKKHYKKLHLHVELFNKAII